MNQKWVQLLLDKNHKPINLRRPGSGRQHISRNQKPGEGFGHSETQRLSTGPARKLIRIQISLSNVSCLPEPETVNSVKGVMMKGQGERLKESHYWWHWYSFQPFFHYARGSVDTLWCPRSKQHPYLILSLTVSKTSWTFLLFFTGIKRLKALILISVFVCLCEMIAKWFSRFKGGNKISKLLSEEVLNTKTHTVKQIPPLGWWRLNRSVIQVLSVFGSLLSAEAFNQCFNHYYGVCDSKLRREVCETSNRHIKFSWLEHKHEA